jgi:uncharacterized protein involved in exopolysaccharide biosynthesis
MIQVHVGRSAVSNGTYARSTADLPLLASPTQSANRRKLVVFLAVFALASVLSLTYTFIRPAEYRASARVQIDPGSVMVEAVKPLGGSQAADAPRPFLTELQVLTSRPVIEVVAARLSAAMGSRLSSLGPDPLATMQSSLEISPAGGTDVVELRATGRDPELIAALVNGVIGAYKERLDQAHSDSSNESLGRITDEVAKLESSVAAKRRVVEAFRVKHNVVSLEREENQLLAHTRGLSASLNTANERLATTEGKLNSLSESAAQGKAVVRARDNPTLANLEQRASQIREELRELERSYTPEYLAMDTRVRAQRTRLVEIDQQIASQRQVAQQAAIAEAEEEVSSARQAAKRLQQQLSGDRPAVQELTGRLNEYKGLQEELTQLESLYRDSVQRKAKLEAGERARRPLVKVIEAAIPPQEPWRPLYMRDAAISVLGSLALALLTMAVVEIFNRADPQPTLLVPQPMSYPMLGGEFAERAALSGSRTLGIEARLPGLLTAEPSTPRELLTEEIGRLLTAGTEEVRLAALLLLSGLSPDELLSLHWEDLDLAAGLIRADGRSPRTVEIFEPAIRLLGGLKRKPGEWLLAADREGKLTLDELSSDLLCAAHDAGIDSPAEVTPDALRHTYLAFLARQGIRLADLVRLVGRLPPEEAAGYSALSPSGTRLALAEVERVIPGVRDVRLA